jgi:hypothetical protein
LCSLRAEVAELADALASGASGRKVVEVQILSSAPMTNRPSKYWAFRISSYRIATAPVSSLRRDGPCDNGAPRGRMKRSTLAMSLTAVGVAVWLASRLVETQPTFALAIVPAVLIFFAFAARPTRS